ncbi:H-NS histone family protein [Azohydromonas aeria]|uniref:H-NS histone family protein n=1 Tax=Azohydromonas aeria TaxID=2590212 RepID=UPI0012F9ED5F|nr:H-NS histone family protein [Azohydromonas aeria]
MFWVIENMAAVEHTGWVKPQRAPTYEEILARIDELRTELTALEQQAADMREASRLEALVKIRNIMRAQQLTVEDILPERSERTGRH